MNGIGCRGAATDNGDAQLTRGSGMPFCHGDCVVLMTGPEKSDTDSIQRADQHRSVVAHQPKSVTDTDSLNVMSKGLIKGHRVAFHRSSRITVLEHRLLQPAPPI